MAATHNGHGKHTSHSLETIADDGNYYWGYTSPSSGKLNASYSNMDLGMHAGVTTMQYTDLKASHSYRKRRANELALYAGADDVYYRKGKGSPRNHLRHDRYKRRWLNY